jgi:DNA-binding CsgD family transcriptional regulator
MSLMCNVRSPKPAESHLLFLIAAMSWLVLFVFYAPGMGLLQKGGDPFNDQNVFLAFYILTVLACMFIPGWYTTARYRALTLAGVAGTVFSAVGVALLMGVLRLGAVGLLGFFCGLFTFAGIVFVLMRLLPFKWQMGAIAFLVSINPLVSILMERSLLSFNQAAYWILCFGILVLMFALAWFGFYRGAQAKNVDHAGRGQPSKTSLTHTRRMLWLGVAIVFVISMILTFAIYITQKRLEDGQGLFFFYLGQMLAGLLSALLIFSRRSKLRVIYHSFLGIAFAGFILILMVDRLPGLQPIAILLLGLAELGSILEWGLIPRVSALWERAHVFSGDKPNANWNLRALRGFFLGYALGILAATLVAEWAYSLGELFFLILSIASLSLLFVGNLLLSGFTRYQFFPNLGGLAVEGPVANEAVRKLKRLSEREKEILGYLLQGYTLPQVAERLYISLNTVKTHGSNIYRKLEVNTRHELFLRYLDVQGRPPAAPAP